jgi:hypothetical protein
MNTSTRTIARSLLVSVGAVGVALWLWRLAHSAPDFLAPVRAQEVVALADGGSIEVVLQDATGARILVGVRGSLNVPPERFPLFLQRWYPAIPLQLHLSIGGKEEFCLVAKLVAWSAATSENARTRVALSEVIRTVSLRHPENAHYQCT